jgi:hypothetical protein
VADEGLPRGTKMAKWNGYSYEVKAFGKRLINSKHLAAVPRSLGSYAATGYIIVEG